MIFKLFPKCSHLQTLYSRGTGGQGGPQERVPSGPMVHSGGTTLPGLPGGKGKLGNVQVAMSMGIYPNDPRIVTPPLATLYALMPKQAGLVRTFFTE